jgi:hypothetical protein
MIEALHDKDGNIIAVIEWVLCDEDKKLNNDGVVMLIGDLEINPAYRGNGVVRKFINILYDKHPFVMFCAWLREYKYPDRKYRLHTREQFKRFLRR